MRPDHPFERRTNLADWTAEDWIIAQREPMDEAERRAFKEWLASPQNADDFAAMAELVLELREAADPHLDLDTLIRSARADTAGDRDNVVSLHPAMTSRSRLPHGRHWIYAAAATAAAVALALTWLLPKPSPQLAEQITVARYVSPHGDRTMHRLPDGSILRLDADSSVALRYSSSERRLDFERGQAIFEIVHDTARPFHVVAGAADIVDVGTTFSVAMHGDSTVVTVVQGRVRVGIAREAAAGDGQSGKILSAIPGTSATGTIELSAGNQVRVVAAILPEHATPVDVGATTAWEQGRIVFNNEPLSQVVEQFNRYAPAPIAIVTPGVGERRVSGSFEATDTESFVAYLRTMKGVRVDSSGNGVQVSGR